MPWQAASEAKWEHRVAKDLDQGTEGDAPGPKRSLAEERQLAALRQVCMAWLPALLQRCSTLKLCLAVSGASARPPD